MVTCFGALDGIFSHVFSAGGVTDHAPKEKTPMKKPDRNTPATRRLWLPLALAAAVAAGLAACGGGGGDSTTASTSTTTTPTATPTSASAVSSGVITAFGSVFVNGHRFHTDTARVIDDDTGTVSTGATGLEVGMVVDVKPRSDDATQADELHVHPLVRGYVDAADSTASTLTVMGQTVQLTASTTVSDHRACLSAATPCTAIATAAGLATTTVNGTATTPGSYVTVHGFLFGGTTANVVATLVSVGDAPTGASPVNYKVEGVANVASSGLTIGKLKLDLSKARCSVAGQPTPCTNAFTNGSVVSAGSATAPALPATVLVADLARQAGQLPVQAAGATVELEGVVSSTGTGTASFVVRGMTVDASALPAGTTLPSVGDEVRVTGTLSATGNSLKATSLTTEHHAASARLTLQGEASNVAAGSTTGTFTLSVLGQTVTVNAQTRLADVSVRGWDRRDPTATPFNITTFQSTLAASASKDVLVVAEADSTGALVAQSLTILPANNVAAVAGTVDATPAPVNSTATGTATVFFVHGVKVSADPAAIVRPAMREGMMGGGGTSAKIAAGDQVIAVGTLTGGAIVVGPTLGGNNRVFDLGVPQAPEDHDRGMF
jgi:hypothetical protein